MQEAEIDSLGRVLVVDDNALVRESLCHVLRERGYTALEAEDGEAALEIVESSHIQIAIVDIMMPTMGGLQLRQVLTDRDPPIPIILVTGQPEIVESLVEDDADFQYRTVSVLQKPVHPVKLLDEVEKRLST